MTHSARLAAVFAATTIAVPFLAPNSVTRADLGASDADIARYTVTQMIESSGGAVLDTKLLGERIVGNSSLVTLSVRYVNSNSQPPDASKTIKLYVGLIRSVWRVANVQEAR
jgi:hypothetical protein